MVNVVVTRFLKFSPIFAIMILVEICLPYFYNGPLNKDLAYSMSENCAIRGWKNLLFFSNFDHPHHMVDHIFTNKFLKFLILKMIYVIFQCLLHTWSTIAEFHLLILSCGLTYVYSRSHSIGIALNLFFILGGILSNAIIIYYYEMQALIFQIPMDLDQVSYFQLRVECLLVIVQTFSIK